MSDEEWNSLIESEPTFEEKQAYTRFWVKQVLMHVDDNNLDDTAEFFTNLLTLKGVTI